MSYVIDRDLGVGPDGPVRRAIADRLGARAVAIRLLPLDDDGFGHLRRHAEALASVGHPHLGLIHDVTRVDDTVLVATTLGTDTLGDRIAQGTLDTDTVVRTIAALAGGLDAAHRAGLVHGAVHTGNVVWAAEPAFERPADVPVLVDLGLHRFRGDVTLSTNPAAWEEDRRAMVALARTLVATLGEPTTTRAAGLAALVTEGAEAFVADPGGLDALARECERLARRPDRPLPVEQPVPVTSAPLRPPCESARRSRRLPGTRRRPEFGRGSPFTVDGRRLLAGAALAAGLVVGVVATFALQRSPGAGDASPTARHPSVDCGPEAATPTPPPGAEAAAGFVDLDADGCADTVWWSPGDATLHVLTDPAAGTTPDRFELGAPGDQLVVGDWDCDGATTPAIYRPDTGETFHFDRWATTDAPVEARLGPVLAADATPQVDGSDDGCDRIIVIPGRR